VKGNGIEMWLKYFQPARICENFKYRVRSIHNAQKKYGATIQSERFGQFKEMFLFYAVLQYRI
jgi:hypothetical protein